MVEKKTGTQRASDSGKKPDETQSRKTKRPVTIDLEATAAKSAPDAKSTAQSGERSQPKPTAENKPAAVP